MLMIDIGNSRIKCAVWDNNDWHDSRACVYQQEILSAQFDELFRGLVAQPVYVACVVDALKDKLTQWVQAHWSVQPVYIASSRQLSGVTNGYKKPEALGVDRWLAVIAAYNKLKSAVCVIDCGTAVTVDIVDASGMHKGGLIMPGLQLMRTTLFGNTSRINPAKGRLVELADNTEDAVESGCVQLLVSGLDQICQQQLKYYPDMKIVVTGGDGNLVAQKMQLAILYVEALVLDGLRLAAIENV